MPLTRVYCILRVMRMLSENQCLFVQVYRALKQPGQVFSRHTTTVLITTEVLFKVFVFILHRPIKSHQSPCQFILLRLFTVSHAAVRHPSTCMLLAYLDEAAPPMYLLYNGKDTGGSQNLEPRLQIDHCGMC